MRRWRMRRDHTFTQRRMPDYLEGDLGGRQQRRLARHADECPDCGAMLRGVTRVRIMLRSFGRPRPQTTVVPSVLERIRHDEADASGGPHKERRS